MIRLAAFLVSLLGAWPAAAEGLLPIQSLTPDTFRAVMKAASASGLGGVINVGPGTYVDVRLPSVSYKFAQPVILKCDPAARFGSLYLAFVENVTFDGCTFTGRLELPGAKRVTVSHGTFIGTGVKVNGGEDIVVADSTFLAPSAAVALLDVARSTVTRNMVWDYAGNAAFSAYGGSDPTFTYNALVGWRLPAAGVHMDAFQTANRIKGKVTMSFNLAILPGQAFFGGADADAVEYVGNTALISFPNGFTWKSRTPALIKDNRLADLPGQPPGGARFMNYGLVQLIGVPAADGGGNTVNGRPVAVK